MFEEYFQSILGSSVFPSEVVFVDDGSTDDSVNITTQFITHNFNLKLVRLEEQVGFANALNIGLKVATSKYIMRLDTDDFICPDRIENQFDYLERNPEALITGKN